MVMSDKDNNRVDFTSMPRIIGKPVKEGKTATAGIVNPMLARAAPSARLRLVCNRLFLAARQKPPGKALFYFFVEA